MIKKFMEKWKEAVFIFMIVALALNFYSWQAEAQEQKTQNQEFKETFKEIKNIAEALKNPNTWLKQYLINHGIDTSVAKQWSSFQRGPMVNDSGRILNAPYLEKNRLPEIGIYKMPQNGSTIVLDTLWDFNKRLE